MGKLRWILTGVVVVAAFVSLAAFSEAQDPSLGSGVATIFNAEIRPAIEVKVVPNPAGDRFVPDANSYGTEWKEKDAKKLDPRPTKTFHLWLEAHNHTSVDQTGTLQIAIIRNVPDRTLTMLDGRGWGDHPEDIGVAVWIFDDAPATSNSLARMGEATKFAFGGANGPLIVSADSSIFFLVRISLGERMRPDSLRIHAWMEPPPSGRTSD